ncbi:MAG: hypothetical protein WA414_14255 [Acidobacteriaceae bacterium]
MDELKAIRLRYRIEAVCSLCLTGLFAIACLSAAIWGDARMNSLPDFVGFPIGLAGACCGFAAFGLLIGMLWDCVFVSQLRISSKIGCILLMFLTFPLGTAIYYFAYYKKRVAARVASDVVAPLAE